MDNKSGIHILRDGSVIRRLVESSAVGPGDLVLEFGAGTGVLTAALAGTGARVIAVERHDGLVARLNRRFETSPDVRVVAADARTVLLPRRPYAVVANLPYAISTAMLRRLLTPEQVSLTQADLLVEWGFAKRVSAAQPRDVETAWWQARFEIRIAGRVGRECFSPPPSVASAHLVVRRRSGADRRSPGEVREALRAMRARRRRRLRG